MKAWIAAKTVTMQKNWIGRSEGCEADFRIAEDESKRIRIFTTRFDTIYGPILWRLQRSILPWQFMFLLSKKRLWTLMLRKL